MELGGIDNLGFDRVLRRGRGEVILDRDDAMLIRDRVSGAYMLACNDTETGLALFDRFVGPDCDLFMTPNRALGLAVFEKHGFTQKLECRQVAYYGEKPSKDVGLTIRPAKEPDLAMLIEHYHMVSPGEMKENVRRGAVLLGYDRDRLVGFVGEHPEGSMGMLYVFPEFRCRGYGAALQKYLIAETMEKGFVPFAQVEKENIASLNLQKKLGMTISENLIVWMWGRSGK